MTDEMYAERKAKARTARDGDQSSSRSRFGAQRLPVSDNSRHVSDRFDRSRDRTRGVPGGIRPRDSPRPQGRQHRDGPAQTTSQRLASLPKGGSGFGEFRPKSQPGKELPAQRRQENVAAAQPAVFSKYPLLSGLQSAVEEILPGQKTMPIQSLALGKLLDNGPKHAVIGAETGSGKSLAYLLPLLHHLKDTEKAQATTIHDDPTVIPRALVLSPTHELTRQSTFVAKSLVHTVKARISGASSPGSVRGEGPIDVLFATARTAASMLGIRREEEGQSEEGRDPRWMTEKDPQRQRSRKDEEREPALDTSSLEWVVIDEADVLLGPAFIDQTSKILAILRGKQRTTPLNVLLVTATLPPSLLNAIEEDPLLRQFKFEHILSPGLHRLPKKLETRFVPWSKGGNVLADVAHEIRRVFADEALQAKLEFEKAKGIAARDAEHGAPVADVSKKAKTQGVVFCDTVGKVERLRQILEARNISCLAWTGESKERLEQKGRNGPLYDFLTDHKRKKNDEKTNRSKNPPRILITTSLLSRGLDFSENVTTTYLLDPPRNVLDFVHRAGRAGRAGREGLVVVFGLKHAGQSKYADELRGVLGKAETRPAVKSGGRTWEGKKQWGAR